MQTKKQVHVFSVSYMQTNTNRKIVILLDWAGKI